MTHRFFDSERTTFLLEAIAVDCIVIALAVLKLTVMTGMDWLWVISPIIFSLSALAIEVIVLSLHDTYQIMKERNHKDYNDL